jgi:hypothetical protein
MQTNGCYYYNGTNLIPIMENCGYMQFREKLIILYYVFQTERYVWSDVTWLLIGNQLQAKNQ